MSKFIVSPKEGVPFVSVEVMATLIREHGIEQTVTELVTALEKDFARDFFRGITINVVKTHF